MLHYEGYGKEYIKKFKASPDAWAQLVKQLAFHKMFSRPGVCYESAQTRKYQRGRTEVIRSASNESRAWAEAMLDPSASVRGRLTIRRHRASACIPLISLGLSTGREAVGSLPEGRGSTPAVRRVGGGWSGRGSALVWLEDDAEGWRAHPADLH